MQPPGNSRRVWRSRAQRPPAPSDGGGSAWSDQSGDPWTGQPPQTVPGWGEDAAPRSRHSRTEPDTDQSPGRHGPPDEPTWASSSLGIDRRPDTARWSDTGEQTWGGQATAPRHDAPSPHEAPARPDVPPRPEQPQVYREPEQYDRGHQRTDYERPAPYEQPGPYEQARRYEPADDGAHRVAGQEAEPEDGWLQLDEEEPAGGWRDRAAKAATPFRRRKGGPVGKIVVISLVVLLCLAVLGGGAYFLWGGKQLGGASEEYFANLTVSELISKAKQNGFECYPGSKIAQCDKEIKGADLGITVHFTGEEQVTKLEASGGTAAYTNDAAKPEELKSFFEWAAGLPLAGSGDAAAAKAWGTEHIAKGGEETFGGIRYEAAADQPLLTMTPA